MIRNAVISGCGNYRYWLERRWAPGDPLVFVMLNPSTADANIDDPTIRKCMGFARALGHGAIIVVNLFAYRSTNPAGLRQVGDPIGRDNDYYVDQALQRGALAIAAWGRHGTYQGRDAAFLSDCRHALYALRINGDGTPAHPLMLPYSCLPARFGAHHD